MIELPSAFQSLLLASGSGSPDSPAEVTKMCSSPRTLRQNKLERLPLEIFLLDLNLRKTPGAVLTTLHFNCNL